MWNTIGVYSAAAIIEDASFCGDDEDMKSDSEAAWDAVINNHDSDDGDSVGDLQVLNDGTPVDNENNKGAFESEGTRGGGREGGKARLNGGTVRVGGRRRWEIARATLHFLSSPVLLIQRVGCDGWEELDDGDEPDDGYDGD
ncbi:hypothetical protein L1887_33119 [Cichorium endivia]|nr:hypothetical protein L1887_33119 [Cichorium endivia]